MFFVPCSLFFSGHLLAAAVFTAVGVLAHYDCAYVAPALAWLVLAGGWRRGWRPGQWLAGLAAPVALGAALLASFFAPFLLDESFARTADYLQGRTGQNPPFNSLPGYYALLSFYSPAPYVLALGAALAASLAALLWAYLRPRPLGGLVAGWLLAACTVLVIRPETYALPGGSSWAAAALGPPLAALALAPATPAPLRALALWFGVPFAVQSFLIADPRTHFYTTHAAAALLIGLGAAAALLRCGDAERTAEKRQASQLSVLSVFAVREHFSAAFGTAGLALLLAFVLPYAWLLFISQRPEYQREFPAALLPLYRPGAGETLPEDGYFGFPHRDGWKVIGELYARGELQGDYDSNQKEFIAGWYTRGAFNCIGDPAYYFVALAVRPVYIPPGYAHYASITVDGARMMDIYSRAPVAGPPRSYELRDYAAAFDQRPVPNFPLRRLLGGVAPQQALGAAWERGVLLHGYDLDRARIAPGQTATLTLYWRASAPAGPGLRPVVELLDPRRGAVVATARPHCGGMPSESWHGPGPNDTAFTITAGPDLPSGAYRLRVRLRDEPGDAWVALPGGGESLELETPLVVEESGRPGGDARAVYPTGAARAPSSAARTARPSASPCSGLGKNMAAPSRSSACASSSGS